MSLAPLGDSRLYLQFFAKFRVCMIYQSKLQYYYAHRQCPNVRQQIHFERLSHAALPDTTTSKLVESSVRSLPSILILVHGLPVKVANRCAKRQRSLQVRSNVRWNSNLEQRIHFEQHFTQHFMTLQPAEFTNLLIEAF